MRISGWLESLIEAFPVEAGALWGPEMTEISLKIRSFQRKETESSWCCKHTSARYLRELQ